MIASIEACLYEVYVVCDFDPGFILFLLVFINFINFLLLYNYVFV